jgi:hypothetical protein
MSESEKSMTPKTPFVMNFARPEQSISWVRRIASNHFSFLHDYAKRKSGGRSTPTTAETTSGSLEVTASFHIPVQYGGVFEPMTDAEPAFTMVVQAQVKFRRGSQVIALTSS